MTLVIKGGGNLKTSRVSNSLKNMGSGVFVYLINMLFQFLNRLLFLRYLDIEYLGINGLFSNILSMLNIAELGIAGAMVYALYKPLSEQNTEELKSIMFLYKKLYRFVGIFVLGIGLLVTPFLSYLINTEDVGHIPYLQLYFILYVLDAGVSYFLSYKRSIIICNQQSFIVNGTNFLKIVLTNILQMIFLVLTRNYFIYLLIRVWCTFGENVLISFMANRQYPYLKEKATMPAPDISHKIKKNILAMSMHKVGAVVVFGTDNIIISKFVSLAATGLYSNYVLITNAAASLLTQFFTAITASVGDYLVEKKEHCEDIYRMYKNILFINFCLYYLVSLGIYICMQNFISIWLGNQYLLSNGVLVCIVLNFFSLGIRKTTMVFKDASGLFWKDRFKPLLEAGGNLIFSIPLAIYFGIAGTIMGTIITNILISGSIEAYITYKYLFKKKVIRFFIVELEYYLILLVSLLVCGTIASRIGENNLISMMVRGLVSVGFSVSVIIAIFFRTEEFKYVKKIGFELIHKACRKVMGGLE